MKALSMNDANSQPVTLRMIRVPSAPQPPISNPSRSLHPFANLDRYYFEKLGVRAEKGSSAGPALRAFGLKSKPIRCPLGWMSGFQVNRDGWLPRTCGAFQQALKKQQLAQPEPRDVTVWANL